MVFSASHQYVSESSLSLGEIVNVESTNEKPSVSDVILSSEIVILGSVPVNCVVPRYHIMLEAGTPMAVQLSTISSTCSSTLTAMSSTGLVMLGRAVKVDRQ